MKYNKKPNTTCDLSEQLATQKAMWAIVLEFFRHVGLTTSFLGDGNFKYMAMRFHGCSSYGS